MKTMPTLEYERRFWDQDFMYVAGVDEVGRGAWAGPVVAAAFCLPREILYNATDLEILKILPKSLRDSKKLSSSQRQQVAKELQLFTSHQAIGQASVEEINELGIGPANWLAMKRALAALSPTADFILIDGYPHPNYPPRQQQAIIKGDAKVASIAAASIVAKVYRDTLMEALDSQLPGYGFAAHKGYGTKQHQDAILKMGLSPLHRSNYNLKFLTSPKSA